uniref:Kinesin-like protein KIF24 n=1 Tax=Lygus hesperus TaxID=30085 RepID=A0A0A9XBY3_LYGHE
MKRHVVWNMDLSARWSGDSSAKKSPVVVLKHTQWYQLLRLNTAQPWQCISIGPVHKRVVGLLEQLHGSSRHRITLVEMVESNTPYRAVFEAWDAYVQHHSQLTCRWWGVCSSAVRARYNPWSEAMLEAVRRMYKE